MTIPAGYGYCSCVGVELDELEGSDLRCNRCSRPVSLTRLALERDAGAAADVRLENGTRIVVDEFDCYVVVDVDGNERFRTLLQRAAAQAAERIDAEGGNDGGNDDNN